MDPVAAGQLARAVDAVRQAHRQLRRTNQRLVSAGRNAGLLDVRRVSNAADVVRLTTQLNEHVARGPVQVVVLRDHDDET